jgi:plastocyanin
MRMKTIAVVALLLLGLVACSGKYKPDSASEPGATGDTGVVGSAPAADCEDMTGGPATVTISDYAFHPDCLIVSASESLTIVSEDLSAHTFTLEGGVIDETLDVGDTVKIKSLADVPPGTYAFNCGFHPPMKGTITIQ